MSTARPFELECGHKIYFSIPPSVGDPVLCRKCGNYEQVGPVMVTTNKTYHGHWITTPTGSKRQTLLAQCLGKNNDGMCHFTMRNKSFYFLREQFELHYLLEHANSSLDWAEMPIPEMTKPLPKGSPAPF